MTQNKNTTSSTSQRAKAPPLPQTTAPPPPPHTTAPPPPPYTTATPPPPHTTKAAPPPQTTKASSPTFEECTFVPTPGVTQHVLQGPVVHHTTVAVEEEERDQTVSDEEQEATKQAFSSGQRPMISIVGNGLAPSGVAAEAIRIFFIKLYHGNYLKYSELKARGRRKERDEYLTCLNVLFSGSRVIMPKCKNHFIKLVVKEYVICLVRLGKRGQSRIGWVKRFMRIFLMGGKQKNSKTPLDKIRLIEHQPEGAVHTMERRAHHDVAIELEKKLRRPSNPDELFMATHKRKNGQWVDRRAEKTHDDYVERLTQATQNDNNVDG